ncbi:hypothetical protein BRADI_5g25265v3 [Brachypodium distachyon]|uniref:Uncharacterized protein n=1 Tax=Brachypodium distachyon TaxID=15368 RepID=A0A2K2CJ98_BRADI|nr:hypothetical protein BRADI_5g25265v3 [Brachypodium distachyon]
MHHVDLLQHGVAAKLDSTPLSSGNITTTGSSSPRPAASSSPSSSPSLPPWYTGLLPAKRLSGFSSSTSSMYRDKTSSRGVCASTLPTAPTAAARPEDGDLLEQQEMSKSESPLSVSRNGRSMAAAAAAAEGKLSSQWARQSVRSARQEKSFLGSSYTLRPGFTPRRRSQKGPRRKRSSRQSSGELALWRSAWASHVSTWGQSQSSQSSKAKRRRRQRSALQTSSRSSPLQLLRSSASKYKVSQSQALSPSRSEKETVWTAQRRVGDGVDGEGAAGRAGGDSVDSEGAAGRGTALTAREQQGGGWEQQGGERCNAGSSSRGGGGGGSRCRRWTRRGHRRGCSGSARHRRDGSGVAEDMAPPAGEGRGAAGFLGQEEGEHVA